MKSFAVAAVSFAIGWLLYRAVRNAPSEEELIRDPSHEFGSSTGG